MKNAFLMILAVIAVLQMAPQAFAERSDQTQAYIDHENKEIATKQAEIDAFEKAFKNASLDEVKSQKAGQKLMAISLPTWLISGVSLGGLVTAERYGADFKGMGKLQQAALVISVAAGVGLTAMEGEQIKVWLDEKKMNDLQKTLLDAQSELDARKATVRFLEKSETEN